MGLCLSKKQRREELPCSAAKKSSGSDKIANKDTTALVPEAKKAPQAKPAPSRKAPPKAEEPAANKRTVFVVKAAAAAAAAEVAAEANGEDDEGVKRAPPPVEEAKPVVVSRVPVRTSSCPKEEVDAILIQCGRLSRSSSASGKAAASGESGGGHQRYSGSKRSYDFDRDRRGGGVDDECDWERHGAVFSRPSPRRRTPERKRSGSHERGSAGGNGSRRVSRSPGRRADVAPAAVSSVSGERTARQPGKMVSVPAREKGRAPSPVKSASSGKRYPSPSPTLRSNSPARAAAVGNENAGVQPTNGPSLSRSSSRKADNSPYRRNPMTELDENTLVNNHHNSTSNSGKSQKKPTAVSVPQKLAERAKDQAPSSRIMKDKPEIVEEAVASDTKAPSARVNATHTVSIVAESVVNPRAGPGGRSSRRSSRDVDHDGNSFAFVEEAVASEAKAPSSRMNGTHSVSMVAEGVVNPKAAPVGRSSRRSSRDFDHSGNSYAFLEEAAAAEANAPSSRMNGMHSVSIVAEGVVYPKAAPVGRSSRRSSRDFDSKGNSYAFLEEAVAADAKAQSSRMNATRSVSIVAEGVVNPKAAPVGRSSRRSSRDFDSNGNSYASLLLEDIQNYHHQNTSETTAAPAFSLPACVSKACSILEAVADLNSSSSESRSFELDRSANDRGSVNGSYSDKTASAAGTLVIESQVVVKDDLMEPSLHKYVSVRDIRGETEPQESAGSNSFAGNPWTCSWEPNSVDSTDRTWTASQSNDGDEAEQHSNGTGSTLEQSWQSKQEPSGRPRVGSTAHHGSGSVHSTSASSSIA